MYELNEEKIEQNQPHPLVRLQLAHLQVHNPKLEFPRKAPEKPLQASDYVHLITSIREKFRNFGSQLQEMVLNCYDNSAIQGIKNYCDTDHSLPFNTLTLNLDYLRQDSEREALLSDLKELLKALSKKQLSSLQLIDLQQRLTDTDLFALTQYIETEVPGIDITLPLAYSASTYQQRIDQRTLSPNLKPLSESTTLELKQAPDKPRTKRTRLRAKKQHIVFDIEVDLQHDHDMDRQLQISQEKGSASDFYPVRESKSQDEECFTLSQFHYIQGLDVQTQTEMLLTDLNQHWPNWIGADSVQSTKSTHKFSLSKAAAEKLLHFKDQFQYGFDFYAGCPGFKVETNPSTGYSKLYYDEHSKWATAYNPLQIQLREPPKPSLLPHSYLETWLRNANNNHPVKDAWHRLNQTAYSKEAHLTFKRFLPQLLQLTPDTQTKLFALSFDKDGFKTQTFQFLLENAAKLKTAPADSLTVSRKEPLYQKLFGAQAAEGADFIKTYQEVVPSVLENHLLYQLVDNKHNLRGLREKFPTINLNALLQLYIQEGESGIEQFIQLTNTHPDLFQEPYSLILQGLSSYASLISPDFNLALQAIKGEGFSPEEKLWWKVLLQQHAQSQKEVHLIDLLNAFKAFNAKLQDLSLKLPSVCELKGVKSLPVALSRILALLQHTSQPNRAAQLREIPYLDFSSRGVIRLVSQPEDNYQQSWAFASREILGCPEGVSPFYASVTEHHGAPKKWPDIHGIPQELKAEQDKLFSNKQRIQNILSEHKNRLLDKFFRYVALQKKNGQLPLEFYKKASETISAKNFTPETEAKLYALIAASTTNPVFVSTVNPQEAFSCLETCLHLIANPPVQVYQERARATILDILLGLNEIPPLPVLTRLVSLISKDLQWSKIYWTKDKLQNASTTLNFYVKTYGNSVYEGMKDYNNAYYDKTESFYNYLDIIDGFHQEGDFVSKSDEKSNTLREKFIRLISTFNLRDFSISTLHEAHLAKEYKRALEALDLLSHLSTLKNPHLPKLDSQNLTNILKEVSICTWKSVAKVLQNFELGDGLLLGAYFPKNVLGSWGKKEFPKDILTKLSSNFEEDQALKVQALLKRIYGHRDNLNSKEIRDLGLLVDKLIAICTPLKALEKNAFIAKLVRSNGICPSNADDNQINSLIKLLDCIKTYYPSPNALNHLIASEQEFIRESEGKEEKSDYLVCKAEMYFSKIVPKLKQISHQAFSPIELAQRLHRTLLMTPSMDIAMEGEQKEDQELKGEELERSIEATMQQYAEKFVMTFSKFHMLGAGNPHCKQLILELFDGYLKSYEPRRCHDGKLLTYLNNFITILSQTFAKIDKNLILALCVSFTRDPGPEQLYDVLVKANQLTDSSTLQSFLNAVVLAVQNGKKYNPENINSLYDLLKTDPEFALAFIRCYQRAPFPPIEEFIRWHNQSKAQADYAQHMDNYYRTHNIKPCRRNPDNGFNPDKAKTQLKHFKGIDTDRVDVDSFGKLTLQLQSETTESLLAQFETFKPQSQAQSEAKGEAPSLRLLVAVAAELLYRSTGTESDSMELNTTQYLALLTSIETQNPHVASQIGTGEGKSRIMMIYNACLLAQGKTVDFVTSGLDLAARDFVTFKPFFEILGYTPTLIYAHMEPDLYTRGGLNISDVANISQFRNMARSSGKSELVIDPKPENRALTLDEADRTLYDLTNNRFNVSRECEESINGMEWVYPLLMEYFAQQSITLEDRSTTTPENLYYDDIDLSRETFLLFAAAHLNPSDFLRLSSLSSEQIEEWQDSAVDALSLRFRDDFDIQPDILVHTNEGPKIASDAQIRFGNRLLKESRYSLGVHQCLHARLNADRNNLDSVTDQGLKNALRQCEYPFHIADEKRIVYSTTAHDFLSDYDQGEIKAVTGTLGSIIERREAERLYGSKKFGSNKQPMHLITVPRHDESLRKDRAIRLTANNEQQFEAIIQELRSSTTKNQPVLLFTEHDDESHSLYQKLQARPEFSTQQINSQTSKEDEKAKINQAGQVAQITVSTDMIARGVDFKLAEEAKRHGFKVLYTYLPKVRDQGQGFGRTSRYNTPGETLLILDKKRLKKALKKTTLTDGFYTNREAYIACEQALMDRESQRKRLVEISLSLFKRELRTHFYGEMVTKETVSHHKKLLSLWCKFSASSTQTWNTIRPQIDEALAAESINIQLLNSLLQQYRNTIQEQWSRLRDEVTLIGISVTQLRQEIPELALDSMTQQLLTDCTRESCQVYDWKVYKEYDVSHEGRAVKYTHWYIPTLASLKGFIPFIQFDNARRPFANIRAWFEGHGQLFAEFRASENKAKIVGIPLLAILGAVAGGILTATEILAPLGFTIWGLTELMTSLLIYSAGGLIAGSFVGTVVGAIIDSCNKPKLPPEEIEMDLAKSPYRQMPGNGNAAEPKHPPPAPGDTFKWSAESKDTRAPSVKEKKQPYHL